MKPSFSARVQKGAFQGALHPRCPSAFPYIGNAPCAAPSTTDLVHAHQGMNLETEATKFAFMEQSQIRVEQ